MPLNARPAPILPQYCAESFATSELAVKPWWLRSAAHSGDPRGRTGCSWCFFGGVCMARSTAAPLPTHSPKHHSLVEHKRGRLAVSSARDPALGTGPCAAPRGCEEEADAQTRVGWWRAFPDPSWGDRVHCHKEWANKSQIQAFTASSDGGCAGKELKAHARKRPRPQRMDTQEEKKGLLREGAGFL